MGAAEDVSLACAYAALILHDGGQKVDAGAIDKMLAAANVKAAGFDACLFEKALTGASVKDLIEAASQVGGGGGGGGAAPAAAAAKQRVKMKHVAAYMLCVLGGNKSPSAEDVKKILSSVNAKADDACLKKVIDEMAGKDLETVIAEGSKLLVKTGGGGGGGGGAAPAAAAAAAPAAAGKAKKAAPPPEEEEAMDFDLFG
eukprot:CAMPEP_0179466080 /NCGR_PEP_ID=MMETSP0799-20121207/47495_1 /TAXON_ID=46947 /ORGANISM="Geminigera cryophila, Strain CCMP2564" /LENGTH=199 /DNA_ID=CAMNT_0021270703 /DNA_START=12 /DNA_END=612 /DNA_ORIENTATION=+